MKGPGSLESLKRVDVQNRLMSGNVLTDLLRLVRTTLLVFLEEGKTNESGNHSTS